MTTCDLCTEDVEEDDVQQCDECERDGLCPDCLADHNCPGSPAAT